MSSRFKLAIIAAFMAVASMPLKGQNPAVAAASPVAVSNDGAPPPKATTALFNSSSNPKNPESAGIEYHNVTGEKEYDIVGKAIKHSKDAVVIRMTYGENTEEKYGTSIKKAMGKIDNKIFTGENNVPVVMLYEVRPDFAGAYFTEVVVNAQPMDLNDLGAGGNDYISFAQLQESAGLVAGTYRQSRNTASQPAPSRLGLNQ